MTGVAVLFFAHLYTLDSPAAFPDPMRSEHVRSADHGVVLTSPEWHRFSLSHTLTTYWHNNLHGTPMMASVRFNAAIRYRISKTTLTLEHEAWHNIDVSGNDQEWTRAGIEVAL